MKQDVGTEFEIWSSVGKEWHNYGDRRKPNVRESRLLTMYQTKASVSKNF